MDAHLQAADAAFKKTLEHLRNEFARLQIGRASASLVESIPVEAYGTTQPLKALASISVPDAKTLNIQPWDRGILSAVEKGIRDSSLGLNPVNDGIYVRINMPPLTEERRKELVKVVHRMAEDARISVRQTRGDAHGAFRDLEKSGDMTEDDVRLFEKKLQEKVDASNKEIEELAKKKEEDILKI